MMLQQQRDSDRLGLDAASIDRIDKSDKQLDHEKAHRSGAWSADAAGAGSASGSLTS